MTRFIATAMTNKDHRASGANTFHALDEDIPVMCLTGEEEEEEEENLVRLVRHMRR